MERELNWDTDELLNWLLNDEELYWMISDTVQDGITSEEALREILDSADFFASHPDIDPDEVDWEAVPAYFTSEEMSA